MNRTFVYLTILVMALVLVAGVIGCSKATSSNTAQQMNTDINGADTLGQDIGSIDAGLNDSALNDSSLADLENSL